MLRALLSELPGASYIYLADSAFAPYGERQVAEVLERSERITRYLLRHHHIDLLVVACNTATALAIDALRHEHPDLPIVGVEPALKPAAQISNTGHIGVLATRATLSSPRFAALRTRLEAESGRSLHFNCQPCDGLADAIERDDEASIQGLCERYMQALGPSVGNALAMDTVVLGCTHYPFAANRLQALCGPGVTLIETGPAVARRVKALLDSHSVNESTVGDSEPMLLTTGSESKLGTAAARWVGTTHAARSISI